MKSTQKIESNYLIQRLMKLFLKNSWIMAKIGHSFFMDFYKETEKLDK